MSAKATSSHKHKKHDAKHSSCTFGNFPQLMIGIKSFLGSIINVESSSLHTHVIELCSEANSLGRLFDAPISVWALDHDGSLKWLHFIATVLRKKIEEIGCEISTSFDTDAAHNIIYDSFDKLSDEYDELFEASDDEDEEDD